MNYEFKIYLDTPTLMLCEKGIMDRQALRACYAAKPPMTTAGDILAHFLQHGNFSEVPGCRRLGKIPDTLTKIAETVCNTHTPTEEKPVMVKRFQARELDKDASFPFLSDSQRHECLEFKAKHGHLPMFRILKFYLNRPDANRDDIIMRSVLGLDISSPSSGTLSAIGLQVNLSRERVRQIANTYAMPSEMSLPSLWKPYADHSTYYADAQSEAYKKAEKEIRPLTFATFATVLERTTMLKNIDDRFLARHGWTKEISAWVKKLTQLTKMPRTIDSHISLEGLAMGGALDTRISLIVLNQICPSLGIKTAGQDGIILPKNQ